MDFNELAGSLNRKVSAAHFAWVGAPIWERDHKKNEPSIVHLTYSAILAVIGDSEVEWVSLEMDEPRDRDLTEFTLTVWTSDLVLQAVRQSEEPHPQVSVEPRSALTGLHVTKAPLLTVADWGYAGNSTEVVLNYPSFKAILTSEGNGDLAESLATFVADLKAPRR